MNWQRIDENTYIDDTLVTCAEYQLFLDEMREQGKYYQPDHWTAYQFSKGEARKAILGVRQSDAVAFCEWLTRRDAEEWKYRLPYQNEVSNFRPQMHEEGQLGYWIIEPDRLTRGFNWIDTIPENVRLVIGDLVAQHAFGLDGILDGVLDIPRDQYISNLNLYMMHRLLFNINIELCKDFGTTLDHLIYNLGALDHNVDRIVDLNLAHALIVINPHARNLVRDLNRSRRPNFDIDQVLSLARKLACDLVNLTLDRALNSPPNTPRNEFISMLVDICADSIKLYVDVYILRERIAGRSPAFEGIRLVKERIR